MSNNTSITATPMGDALRMLAAIADGAPSLHTSLEFPTQPSTMQFTIKSRDVVKLLAQDLRARVEEHESVTGKLHTGFTVSAGLVQMHVVAITDPESTIRRPADVTALLEEQAS